MAPRKKAAAKPVDLTPANPGDLVAEYHKLNDHFKVQQDGFNEAMKPCRERIEEIRSTLHKMALDQRVKSFKTDAGTAYLSEIVVHKIDPEGAPYKDATGRDALLDWMLDNWDEFGNEGMQLNISKAIVDKWRASHDGAPPPGLKLDTQLRLNINRS